MKNSTILYFLFFITAAYSQAIQPPKSVKALRISEPVKIDGVLNEAFWDNAHTAKDFVMIEPGDGLPERDNKKTEVKIVYDNEAIYFGAILYDTEPEKIPMQFGGRDEFGNVDFFLVAINPNFDGQNDTEFVVMSTGAQGDAKVTNGREDFSWNAVWDSKVTINKTNWVVEIKIPYSALRFSNSVDTWGINFHRRIHSINEQYVWNYVDKKIGRITQYAGKLENITGIEPPVRLSFSPYASAAYTSFDGESESDFNVGLDVKYGISESFTLDATLIPDFGQTAFDNLVLNLGPFEQQYRENRAFFTEGTELFGKGNLFYSRRIGNTPINYDFEINDNEEIVKNPESVNMLNALKVSGRTKNGLGIGFFNAITEKTSAIVNNLTTNQTREVVTEPLANYNVLVLDQQFNTNSSVTLVNTNVLRNGSFRDANVTAILFNLANKSNKYRLYGDYKLSTIRENSSVTNGYSAFLEFAKIYGNYQFEIGHTQSNDTYDISDLGFQRRNNFSNFWGEISYRIFEPTKHFNSFRVTLRSRFDFQNEPNDFAGNEFELRIFASTINRFAFGFNVETNIGDQYDFFEPRVDGRFFKQNAVYVINPWISSDYRNKFALDLRLAYAKRYNIDNDYFEIDFSPRYRFSDKLNVVYSLNISQLRNEKGWVNELENGEIIFGNRNVKNIVNSISGKLNFNTKSSLGLAFRHYWSPVSYASNFYELNNNGTLTNSNYLDNHDVNYNIWNLDLSYSWEFAPGSQLVALYRNSIFNEDNLSQLNFNQNLENLFKEPITNNFSIKFIYFLDYNNLKTWL
jgi:hypothetical protein